MNNNERINLIQALTAASNIFHDTLSQYGYRVCYGLDDSKTGSIRKAGVPAHEAHWLGEVTIFWKIREG